MDNTTFFVLTFNLANTSEYYTCLKGHLNSLAQDRYLFVGLQEVPPAVRNEANNSWSAVKSRVTRSPEYGLYVIGNCACLYKKIYEDEINYFVTGNNDIQAIRHPNGIGFINTHRSPSMTSTDSLRYWTTLKCTISRLLKGGLDSNKNPSQAMKGVVLVGDFNADIGRTGTEDINLKKMIDDFHLGKLPTRNTFTSKDGTKRRYDYILFTKNISISSPKTCELKSDHQAISAELQLFNRPVGEIPGSKSTDLTWPDFCRQMHCTSREKTNNLR